METLFAFLLNSSLGIILFYLVYWFFLRNETFYRANRWFLLLALIISVLIPAFPLKYSVIYEPENVAGTIGAITDTFKNVEIASRSKELKSEIFNWKQGLTLIYFTGTAIFLLRLLLQTFILIHMILKFRIKKIKGMLVVENKKYGLPFSFFNIIFINPKFHTQENLPEILAHENVHIREHHWFDLLFIELLTVIFWFNPFIWFFERSIKQNHEYLADNGVISMGHSAARYQALLLNQLMGMQIIGITNNLNFALNTNRLKMMTKKKTSAFGRVKMMWALPAVALLLFAFAEPDYKITDMQKNEISAAMIDYSGQESIKLKGTVVDEDGDRLPGTSIVIKGSMIGTVSDLDGTFSIEIPENSDLVLSFVGKKSIIAAYSEIALGQKKDGAFVREYKLEDLVANLINKDYSGEQLIPPPPPPPPKVVEVPVPANGKTPPPPPTKANGEEEVFYIVEDWPKYPGDWDAMQDYISKMQQKIAQSKGIKGKAKVLFTVNAKGKVSDIKIVEKDNDGAAKGAVALVSEMPDWTPGKQRGKSVPVKYLLPVEFK